MPKASDGAKKLIGDFSPKLVELTDRVLFDECLGAQGIIETRSQFYHGGGTHRVKSP